MKKIEFHYRQELSRGEIIFRPVGKIILEHNKRKVLIYPYIDSGADVTLIPKSVGEILGLSLEQRSIEELSGIGEGKVAVIHKVVEMTIGEEIFDCHIY